MGGMPGAVIPPPFMEYAAGGGGVFPKGVGAPYPAYPAWAGGIGGPDIGGEGGAPYGKGAPIEGCGCGCIPGAAGGKAA